MSQAQDMAAINDYMNRTAGKTEAARNAKASWTAWYNGLSFLNKNFSAETYAEAVKRRTAFNAAQGTPEVQNDGGLTKEEQQYFLNLPVADVTGKTPEQAAVITAAARKKGQQMKVPATLTAAGYKVDQGTATLPANMKKKAAEAAATTDAIAAVKARGTIKLGSKGDVVKEWQGIVGVPQTGIFDKTTDAATKKFQSAHALKPDGVVGPATWTAALGTSSQAATAVAAVTPKPPTAASAAKPPVASSTAKPPTASSSAKPPTAATAAKPPAASSSAKPAAAKPASAGIVASKPTLRLGSAGKDVMTWQGYLEIPKTGLFDASVETATKKWQAANGLIADGVVGASSWQKMLLVPGKVPFFSTASQTGSAMSQAGMVTPVAALNKLPTWAKWALGILGLGGLAYAVKRTKVHPNKFGQQDLDRKRAERADTLPQL